MTTKKDVLNKIQEYLNNEGPYNNIGFENCKSQVEHYLNVLKDQGIIKEDSIKVFKTKLPRKLKKKHKKNKILDISCSFCYTDTEIANIELDINK